MLELNQQMMIVDRWVSAADEMGSAARRFEEAAAMQACPHVFMRPRVFHEKPGVWCAMYGENLVEGVAGFGDSPRAACDDFDRRWNWSQAQIDKVDAEKAK